MALPALLLGTLALPLAGRLGPLAGRAIGFIRRRPGLAGLAGGAALGLGAGALADVSGLTGDGRPRRRRRRALTADDMRTALTLASAISKKAAENFVLQRVRR